MTCSRPLQGSRRARLEFGITQSQSGAYYVGSFSPTPTAGAHFVWEIDVPHPDQGNFPVMRSCLGPDWWAAIFLLAQR